MLVNARRLIRKLRGGAQSHLVEADDGHFYVVKFRNNPQHRRILVNEWIATIILEYLQIGVPARAIVRISEDFVQASPELYIQIGSRREGIVPGWHFGSRYPGHPDRNAVYDFLPDALLDKIGNRTDFLGVLAFDKWMGNADARQAIFLRARLREYAPAYADHPLRVGFVALMIDHGYVMNGPHWEYTDAPTAGLYFRPSVYSGVRGFDDFQPWLERIENFPELIIDDCLRELPPEWLNGDTEALDRVLEQLMERRRLIPDLLGDCIQRRSQYFPNWKL
jgi:hypothetical protein